MHKQTVILILVFGVFVIASIFGTYSLSKRQKQIIDEQGKRLKYQQEELDRARDALRMQDRPPMQTSRGPVFSGISFDNLYLKGITISSDSNAFQRTSFRSANLDGATLKGGVSSFQFACFDQAMMKQAQLTGDASSFALATFVAADLTGASLQGNFQKASFEKATLAGASWSGSFQGCNISGARFEGANLTQINASDLESCYFNDAPTYSSKTKFPKDFAPERQGWKRVGD